MFILTLKKILSYDNMENKKICPSCNELNEVDHKFCIYCGRQFNPDKDYIKCPKCSGMNYPESIECRKCGYLLREDIKKTFPNPSKKDYKKCPECGNILPANHNYCSVCGYDFNIIQYDYASDVFKINPEFKEYGKNILFFKEINKFHDYDSFLYRFKEFCNESYIDTNTFKIGMIKCPECSDYLSFISPHFIINKSCPHCGFEFDFDVGDAYCLNCGRPVRDCQTKCECGYEFKDIVCANCKKTNPYTNTFCTFCAKRLWSHDFKFPNERPQGCRYENNTLIFDWNILKEKITANLQKSNEMRSEILQSQYMKHKKVSDEIASRWWIVSPSNCKSCQSKIEPLSGICPKCGIEHHPNHDNRINELKTIRKNYPKSINELDNLEGLHILDDDEDLNNYLNTLAPMIWEHQPEYLDRLFRHWAQNSFILYIIRTEWNIYFEDICINCGSKFEKYGIECPSCGMRKDVTALSVLFRDNDTVTIEFNGQYDVFTRQVKKFLRENRGDLSHFNESIVGCPECLNYFNYLSSEFVHTRRCPHCGIKFDVDVLIPHIPPSKKSELPKKRKPVKKCESPKNDEHLEGEWELYGITQDMWEAMIMESIEDHKRELEK